MVTVKDIAKASGVSPSTVSIILNGKSEARKISEPTCKKVWDVVRELGYQPNIAARTLRDRNDNGIRTIALYWANDFRTSMLSRFLKGLEQVSKKSDQPYEIVVYTYANDELAQQEALLTGKRFHAAIIANASLKDMAFIENVVFPVPVVLYNRQAKDYYCVTVDNYKMGHLAAEAFLSRQKKHPWIITSTDVFPGMDLRIQGFCETLSESGIIVAASHILSAMNTLESGAELTKQLLSTKECCDSIFCLSDAIGYGTLFTLNQFQVHIPEEISVISIGNGEAQYSQFCTPPLSNVYLPMEDMARNCLDILLRLLNHQTIETKNLLLDTPLTLRIS